MFTSFFDAPEVFRGEISEFTAAGGLEFSYYNAFFLRTGIFMEKNPSKKGNRQHFAAGLGFNINPVRIDMSYVFPTSDRFVMKNTMHFTLSFTPGGM